MSDDGSFLLSVRVKPRAKRAGLLGWHGDGLKVAVRAAPERGRANAELLKILAKVLDLPEAALALVAGAASRDKKVRISGLDQDEVRRRLGAAAS